MNLGGIMFYKLLETIIVVWRWAVAEERKQDLERKEEVIRTLSLRDKDVHALRELVRVTRESLPADR